MTLTNDRYINLFTDFGFKKLSGEQPNKDLLIAILKMASTRASIMEIRAEKKKLPEGC